MTGMTTVLRQLMTSADLALRISHIILIKIQCIFFFLHELPPFVRLHIRYQPKPAYTAAETLFTVHL